MWTIALIIAAAILITCGAMPHMSRPRRANTNVYRQIDPNVLRQVGQPINASIQSITSDPLDATYVYIYFDAPVVQVGGSVTIPDWSINGHSFGGGVDFSADSRVMHLKMAAAITVGNACSFQPTIDTDGFRPLTGGLINGFFGTVQTQPTGDQFNVVSVTPIDADTVLVEFDAALAITAAGIETADVSGLAMSGGTTLTNFMGFVDDNQIQFEVSAGITSGQSWTMTPPDIRQWVSVAGATIAAGSGTIDPA